MIPINDPHARHRLPSNPHEQVSSAVVQVSVVPELVSEDAVVVLVEGRVLGVANHDVVAELEDLAEGGGVGGSDPGGGQGGGGGGGRGGGGEVLGDGGASEVKVNPNEHCGRKGGELGGGGGKREGSVSAKQGNTLVTLTESSRESPNIRTTPTP